MAARRVFVDRIQDSRAFVQGDRARHLSRVVRLRPGETVEVSNFQQAFRATVERSTPHEVSFELLEALPEPPPAPKLELWLAVVKFPRFEWALEKAVELGVERIVVLDAERSDRRLVEAAPKRLERWRRLAEEAAQQSRRLKPPEIAGPAPLGRPEGLGILLDFDGPPLKSVVDAGDASLAIGPEGGWAETERKRAIAVGWQPARLGATVLRTETAAVAGLAALGHLLEPSEAEMLGSRECPSST